jgi:hypothetical protein
MRATAWHNGGSSDEPGAYGFKLTEADRDRHFERGWSEIVVELDGGDVVKVPVSHSFWRHSTELRSAELGRWMLAAGHAPWPKGQPPGFVVTPVEGNRFTVRVLPRHNLL